jgi:two-component system sensor histidine kinase/response regulator
MRARFPIPPASANILIADDVGPIQEVISAMLTKAGHRVRAVNDGSEAVLAVRQSHYDIVLMDMEMPNMDGISATRAIRALDGPMAQMPIIALTANASLQDNLRCKEAGMNGFLQKPIKRAALLAAIARYAPKLAAPTTVPSAQDDGLDTKMLDDLEALLGRNEVAQLCTKFLNRLESELAGLAGTDGDASRHAHTLVGLAGQFGCVELSDLSRKLCEAIEQRARNAVDVASQVTAAATRAANALRLRYAI